ncbi:MAG: hypothetical protein HYU71_08990 [Bacteroidetes bacterium]|nr:hypothetical protein [Bacteroidota bacterium]
MMINGKKKKLIVAVKNPFRESDVIRFNIEGLADQFDLIVLDCSEWLMPISGKSRGMSEVSFSYVKRINTYRDLKNTENLENAYVIDFVGLFSTASMQLFDFLISRGCKVVVIDSGPYPSPGPTRSTQSLINKIRIILTNRLIQRFIYARWLKFYALFLKDLTPDIALVSGTSWKSNPRFFKARKIVAAHSFDCETFLEINAGRGKKGSIERSEKPFAVYLDENIACHEDNAEMGLKNPVSGEGFLGTLHNYFLQYEKETGNVVKIAAYPSTDISLYRQYFGDREILFKQTASLIKDSEAVFAHASTAISFCVLWKKPVFFLVNDEIKNSWYLADIESAASLLNAPMCDINSNFCAKFYAENSSIDQEAYKNYLDTYIQTEGSPSQSLWMILKKTIEDS